MFLKHENVRCNAGVCLPVIRCWTNRIEPYRFKALSPRIEGVIDWIACVGTRMLLRLFIWSYIPQRFGAGHDVIFYYG